MKPAFIRISVILLVLAVMLAVTMSLPLTFMAGIAGWQVGGWAHEIGNFLYKKVCT